MQVFNDCKSPDICVTTARLRIALSMPSAATAIGDLSDHPQVRSTLKGQSAAGSNQSDGGTDESSEYAVYRDSSDIVIGAIWLCEGRISYFIAPHHWGCGLGGEALSGFCKSSPVRTWKLDAVVMRSNIASRRILEGAGFQFCGLIGGPANLLQYCRSP